MGLSFGVEALASALALVWIAYREDGSCFGTGLGLGVDVDVGLGLRRVLRFGLLGPRHRAFRVRTRVRVMQSGLWLCIQGQD